MPRRAPRILLTAALLSALLLTACDGGRDRLRAVATLAASPAGGRAAAAAALTKLLASGKVTADRAIDAAVERLDALPDVLTATAPSLDATAFAGAVLDAITTRERDMLTGAEYELFWRRVGGLAFRAAEEANARARVPEARSLVFAGGQRWQSEAYWRQRPDHLALAALILSVTDGRAAALELLRAQGELQFPADAVLQGLLEQR